MNKSLANKIFKKLNDNFDQKSLSNQNRAILASILSLMADKPSPAESDEMISKYLTNLQEFFQNPKMYVMIESMKDSEIGMFLSFVACGTQSLQPHQQAVKQFAQEQIVETVKKELVNSENDLDITAINQEISDELDNLINPVGVSKKKNYSKILKIIAAYISNKNRIAVELIKAHQEIAKSNLLPEQKKSISKTTKIATFVATLLGIGVALIGGISLIELIIPLSIGLTTSLVVNKLLTQNALKEASLVKTKSPLERKKTSGKFNEITEALEQSIDQELETSKQKSIDHSIAAADQFQEIFQIKETLKGVMGKECDLSIESSTVKPSKTPEMADKSQNILGK